MAAVNISTPCFNRHIRPVWLNEPLDSGTYNVMVFAPGFLASSDSKAVDGRPAQIASIT